MSPRRSAFSGQLDSATDELTLLALCTFIHDELCREREARRARNRRSTEREEQLSITFDVLMDLSTELRARGSLRSPTMFSAVDDTTVMGVAR